MPSSPTPTTRGEQAKTQLIAAGIELFGEKGPQTATTREIAQRSGQNIAAIFYYFGSKEGLYLAVAQWIADFIKQALSSQSAKIDLLLAQPEIDAAQCRHYLHECMMTFTELLASKETLNLSKIISREQLTPTEAYTLIHQQAIAPMHQRMTRLVAGFTGCDAASIDTMLHTHALLGEVLSFRLARETILLRAGWRGLGPAQVTQINRVLAQHIDWFLNGLRAGQADNTGKTT
ncbi:transcriptional regulator CecR [Acerihabitans arboris]|uniref:Transcriptional regulator CecR n=1 Tax=Acerihabitans arboris TaxID=2691583 RepID=A0A845SM74_9GAMM|nr:transcriptional regulator CecR [Acerihabitans arboris]NDL64076.1 transcriptional regulator CecR [Acerihabitans arboris]